VAPEVHLPESILGMNVTLGEKQIMCAAGVDVRNAKFVTEDIYRIIQTRKLDIAVSWRERALDIDGNERNQNEDKDTYEDQQT
jgi:hypothetical protein